MPETIKIFASTKSRVNEDTNGKNLSHLEVTEVLLVHFNFVSNNYQQYQRVLYTFLAN